MIVFYAETVFLGLILIMKQFFVSLVEDGLFKFVGIKQPEIIRLFPNADETLFFLKLLHIDISGNSSGHDIDGGFCGFRVRFEGLFRYSADEDCQMYYSVG